MAIRLSTALTSKDEEENKGTTLELLRFIHNFQRKNRKEVPESEILGKFNELTEDELAKKDLRGLQTIDYVYCTSIKDELHWGLTDRGHEFLRNEALTHELIASRLQQKKSSAVETLFTIALLLFAGVQVQLQLFSKIPSSVKTLFTISTVLVVVGVLGAALIIGGDNLLSVWSEEKSKWINR